MNPIHQLFVSPPPTQAERLQMLVDIKDNFSSIYAEYLREHSSMVRTLEAIVLRMFGVSRQQLHSKTKKTEVVQSRTYIWVFLHEYLGTGKMRLGMIYQKSHSTVIWSFTEHEKNLKDKRYKLNFEMFFNDAIEAVA